MLSSLKFVQGAVAKKDYVPSLSHFHISGGMVLGYNGALALCTPIGIDLSCSPKAKSFIKAIQTCKDETIQLNLTPNGRLAVRSGGFTAYVDCIEESFPSIGPDGDTVELQSGFLKALEVLSPFIGEDASRPWARGILLRGSSAYATNNVIAVEHWLGAPFPVEVNIPDEAVTELLRIGEEPTKVQVCENAATFHFAGNRWLRTALLSTKWPEVDKILDVSSSPAPLPQGIFNALTDLLPFVEDLERVFFRADKAVTVATEGTGASIEIPGLIEGPCFNIKHFLKLEHIATSIDLSLYPKPCIFYGEKTRGAIVGMRY